MHENEMFMEEDENGRLYDPRLRAALLGSAGEPAREALAALRVASHHFRISMDRWLERHGLSESRMGVVWMIRARGPLTLGDLASALDSSPRNITGLVDHLEKDGIVERFPDPEDRRATRVRLSARGESLLSRIKAEMESAREIFVEDFSDEELEQLRHLCLKLVRNMLKKKELEKV